MKKIMKSRIFLVIITTIIVASVSVYAAVTYKASDIVYNASNGTSMNVNDALNELYNKTKGNGYYYSYKNGAEIYYNPVSGTKCNSSEAVSTTETKTGCMKWYAFNDDSDSSTVTMILDHNTTAGIAWSSDNKNVAYEQSDLKEEVDKLVSESKWVDTPRLISAEEIVQITGKISFVSSDTTNWFYFDSNCQTKIATSTLKSRYAWLYDYTNGCTSYGCNVGDTSNIGYWTSTPEGNPESGDRVWDVSRDGYLSRNHRANNTTLGIRPVITISKSKLS